MKKGIRAFVRSALLGSRKPRAPEPRAPDPSPPDPLEVVLAFHQRTKHHPHRFAPALGFLDWDSQPDPFRRFAGAQTVPLLLAEPTSDVPFEAAFVPGHVPKAGLDRASVSQLFRDSLGLSAWKSIGEARWSLRVNPSSGNLHPTEGYLVAGAIDGLCDRPGVFHYAPHDHLLELRATVPDSAWQALAAQLPAGSILIGLTSIHWRESWKYGERAFRYSHHDVGHAVGALAIAAAALGWEARVLESVDDETLGRLLGVASQTGPEAEHPDALLALYPQGVHFEDREIFVPRWEGEWYGMPNELSREHHEWPVIDAVAEATTKRAPPPAALWSDMSAADYGLEIGDATLALRPIIHQRRSAVAMDGRSGLTRSAFLQILRKVMPGTDQIPHATLPWQPRIDLLLFVHRVADLEPGLYALLRQPDRPLRDALDPTFVWERPTACSLPLFLLRAGDARSLAAGSSCGQEIAGDGVFAIAMLAEYRRSLEVLGPWFYRRLHWEAGLVGQVLYLEAEGERRPRHGHRLLLR